MQTGDTQRLQARSLSCTRDGRALFDDLSFTIGAGEWVQISGANGAGKTTLLRMLTGLAVPESGQVCYGGSPLSQVRGAFYPQLLWIGHQPGVNARLSALENLAFYHPDATAAQYLEALACCGLAGYEDLPVARLSAGQQRRVALSRLWLTRATIWILDEPFTALDASGVAHLTRHMAAHTRQGGMVILTTHQPLMAGAWNIRRIALPYGEGRA
ncbi:cytochrome c biogenesis heme-transporting ATPase CcmA [Shimwellia blattae]|uniref:Heme exporter protein A n=1 Tax=Shimwellia blattae (strain ATCC 29907 / DSM 4481 / JCM 1650 / NBRC 105725 / CDC 9005-74) TaxID=630626 RepID=I2B9N1_SHIBC|nr:cytochrome c biogenesis heme-transporting ATPase CcmA [Shimwellia blattae]AFJ47235.1 heme exporter protein A [Shimwellia blattae DSM 4481 = NBRC 105725]GAB82236.1 heme ABC transporter ATP-binding protein CcmA [Shimwellia blattae DSM 4481 = NBRC 105725]VDY64727.1 Cytochrome c biogenesis ATP-binding export protein CcmA [Shimwellia blattae]VEC22827.1 Cytochrome c biogenesis ATP-binding export protein CcmA [Shimwellia blattae]